jgi:hypothetical protein
MTKLKEEKLVSFIELCGENAELKERIKSFEAELAYNKGLAAGRLVLVDMAEAKVQSYIDELELCRITLEICRVRTEGIIGSPKWRIVKRLEAIKKLIGEQSET